MDIRPESINLLKEITGDKFLDISLSFGFDNKSKGNKSKNKQVGLHQTEKLLHSKENYQQNEKVTYQMGGDTCKQYIL